MLNSSHLKKIHVLIATMVIFSGNGYKASAQLSPYLDFLGSGFKWQLMQQWNTATQQWNDTVLSYIVAGENNKPSAMIHKAKDQEGSFQIIARDTFIYEGEKIKTTTSWILDPNTNEFETEPYSSTTYWFSGDKLIKTETMSRPFVSFADISKEFAALSKIIVYGVTGYRIERERVIADSTLIKYGGLTSEELQELGFILEPEDTNWTLQSKSEYTYFGNSTVTLIYNKDAESAQLTLDSKDSTVMDGEKHSEVYTYTYTDGDVWVLSSLIKCSYEGDRPNQVLYQTVENNVPINENRVLFFYTPYNGSGVKYLSGSSKGSNTGAVVSSTHGHYAVNLTLEKPAEVSVYLTDLKGRKAGIETKIRLSSGTHSVPLRVASPGKYLCHVKSGQNRDVVPFTKIR